MDRTTNGHPADGTGPGNHGRAAAGSGVPAGDRAGAARGGGGGPAARTATPSGDEVGSAGADAGAAAGGHGATDVHERARQGVEHLQAAARELIQAARAALDVAEELVNDPDSLASLTGMASVVGDLARRVTGGAPWPPGGGDPGAGPESGSGAESGAGDEGGGRVQRITVR